MILSIVASWYSWDHLYSRGKRDTYFLCCVWGATRQLCSFGPGARDPFPPPHPPHGCPAGLGCTKGRQEGKENQVSCETRQHHSCLGLGVLLAVAPLSPRGAPAQHQQQGCGGNLCFLHALEHLE